MKNPVLTALLFSITFAAQSQSLAINGTGASADASAILDVQSTTKGLLAPKMTAAQRTAISSPATGLVVYQTDGTTGFYYNAGTSGAPSWMQLLPANASGASLTNLNAGNITTGTLAAANGGTGQSSYAVGDLLYASTTTALSKLSAGTNGQVLTSNGSGVAPSWQAASSGGAPAYNVLTKSANYIIQSTDLTNDLIIICNSTSSQTDFTLPAASSVAGKRIYLASTGNITAGTYVNVKTTGTDKIFGLTTGSNGTSDYASTTTYPVYSMQLISNGINWYLVTIL